MKSASDALKSHLAQDSTTLAYLRKLTRQDGTILSFSTHDEDILYPAGIDLSPAEKTQVLVNAAAAPPAPVLSGGTPPGDPEDGPTVYLTYVSEVIVNGVVLLGIDTESLASPGTIGNYGPTVASPPPPASPAQAFAYNVYSTSTRSGPVLQNTTPIPLGTDFIIPADAYNGNRALSSESQLTLDLTAASGDFSAGANDGYTASFGGGSAQIGGLSIGNGYGLGYDPLTGAGVAPIGVVSLAGIPALPPTGAGSIIAATLHWKGLAYKGPTRLLIPNADPCANAPYVSADPRGLIAHGSTELGDATPASDQLEDYYLPITGADFDALVADPAWTASIIGYFWWQQPSSFVGHCGADGETADNLEISDFHIEITYRMTAVSGGPGLSIFPLAGADSLMYVKHFSNTAKQGGSNL
jgi:Uncharacterized conserved protein (DUF2163)